MEAALAIQEVMQYYFALIHSECAHYNAVKCYAAFKERYGDKFTNCYYSEYARPNIPQLLNSII